MLKSIPWILYPYGYIARSVFLWFTLLLLVASVHSKRDQKPRGHTRVLWVLLLRCVMRSSLAPAAMAMARAMAGRRLQLHVYCFGCGAMALANGLWRVVNCLLQVLWLYASKWVFELPFCVGVWCIHMDTSTMICALHSWRCSRAGGGKPLREHLDIDN